MKSLGHRPFKKEDIMKTDQKVKWYLSGSCLLLSAIIFYCLFFMLAPYIASSFQSEIARLVVYLAVGYAGGIAIPFLLIVVGIYILCLD